MAGLYNLIRYITVYRFWQAKIRTGLSIGGIVLGVATIVAVGAMNDSILGSFKKSVDEVSGKAEIEVAGGKAGFPEDVYDVVQKVAGVKAHTPVFEATGIYTTAGGRRERLFIMGIDTLADQQFRTYKFTDDSVDFTDPIEFLSKNDSLILTEGFAKAHGLKMDDTVPLTTSAGRKDFVVRGLLEAEGVAKTFGGAVALMDVYAAQIAFERERTLDRVDVIPDDPERIDEVMAALRKAVPSGIEVRRPFQRSGYVAKLLRSFKSALMMGSMLALLTGMFLIYNTIGISVVQRRKEIGILRSIGVPRRRIRLLFTMEALLMGTVGSIAGIPVGLLLAKGLLGAVSRSVSEIYLRVDVKELTVSPRLAITGAALGVLATVLAALYPAAQASRVTVLETLRITAFDVARAVRTRRSLVGGGCLLLIAYGLSRLPPVRGFPVWAYASALSVLIGVSFLTPPFLRLYSLAVRPVMRRFSGVLGTLAADNLVKALGRSSITVAALMIGLSMMVCVAAFLRSIKSSMEEWIDTSINANLIVTASSRMVGPSATPMAESLGKKLERYEGVAEVTYFRMLNVNYEDSVCMLVTVELVKWIRHNHFIVFAGDVQKSMPRVLAGEAVFVSDNFARLYRVGVGDRIAIGTPTGERSYDVLAVVRDFTSDNGVILGDRIMMVRDFKDPQVDSFGMYLAPGVDERALRDRVARDYGADYNLNVLTNSEFKDDIYRIVDDSFAISYALELLALLVSLLGIINTLLAQVIDRTRVLGVLRAIGTRRAQVRRLVMAEAGLLGMAGNILGVLSGFILSIILVYVLNAQNTGWVVDYHFPLYPVLSAFVTALAVAIIAGYYPAARAASLDIVKALEYE